MMAWVQRLFGAAGGTPAPGDDFWYGAVSAPPAAGFKVTEASALTVPAVYDCLQVISKPVATLPLKIFRRLPGGGKEPARNHPLFEVLARQPNPRATAWEFRGQMQWDLGLHNNAYAEILEGRRGPIDQLVRLDPKRTKALRLTNGAIVFETIRPDGRTERLREDQVWHLKGLPLSDDGITARPQLETGRNTISAALALLDYSARFFANDTQSGGVIEHPQYFKDKESRNNFKRAWEQANSGTNRHKDKVLEHGMTYKRTASTNEEAQFLETRKELWIEVTQIWQVPPHKIGIFDGATKSNVEQQALTFLMEVELSWLVLWEQAIVRDLLFDDDIFFAEFNLAGLLRGDLKTRYEAYFKGRQGGWLSINDVRGLENMNPIESGDDYLQPLNMAPIGEARPNGPTGGAGALANGQDMETKGNGHARSDA